MKREPIRLRKGTKEKLAKACGVSPVTVYNAMHYRADSEIQNFVRAEAKRLGYIRRF